jgi:predicted  nucleic acid-binding Zn-ribbon protein
MKSTIALLLCLIGVVAADVASPVAKVIELLQGMTKKVQAESDATVVTMKEAKALCEKRDSDLKYSIKTYESQKSDLTAQIGKSASKFDSYASEIQETLSKIASNEADLKAATDIRETEKKDFQVAEKDLVDTLATIEKATVVLQKQVSETKVASLLQNPEAVAMLQVVEQMVSASTIASSDSAALTALLQKSDSMDEDFQAPTAAPYEKKSGGIIELLEDLYEKAKVQLTDIRKKEEASGHNFAMLAQGLNDEIKFANSEVSKARISQQDEANLKASSEKKLEEVVKNLQGDTTELKDLIRDCQRAAADFETEQKDRAEELKALAAATEALVSKTAGAAQQQYGLLQDGVASFLQLGQMSRIKNKATLHQFEVVHMIRDLAHHWNSHELSLLAQRIGSVIRSDESTTGPFDKIVNMVQDMIAGMEKSLKEDTTKKAYCDAEMAKAKKKQGDKQGDVDKAKAKIEKTASDSAQLKAQVKELQAELSKLANSSSEMVKLRNAEKSAFEKNYPEMEQGLEGVKIALKLLRGYYQGTGKESKSTGIIGMLEVCEADFAKTMTELKVAEKTAAENFEKEQQEMAMEKARKEQDAKYKTEAATGLDKDLVEFQSDADALNTEMAAILEFNRGLEAECTETKESFAQQAAKRQAEIDGLKAAIAALNAQTAPAAKFLQRRGHLQL